MNKSYEHMQAQVVKHSLLSMVICSEIMEYASNEIKEILFDLKCQANEKEVSDFYDTVLEAYKKLCNYMEEE